jgi:hypothetical protein
MEKRPIWGTDTGRFNLTNSVKSDLVDYGSGAVIFFQFLKFMGFLFAILLVLSLPSLVIYWSSYSQNSESIDSLVVSSSLGSIFPSKFFVFVTKFRHQSLRDCKGRRFLNRLNL